MREHKGYHTDDQRFDDVVNQIESTLIEVGAAPQRSLSFMKNATSPPSKRSAVEASVRELIFGKGSARSDAIEMNQAVDSRTSIEARVTSLQGIHTI